jgi:hypothetical protein
MAATRSRTSSAERRQPVILSFRAALLNDQVAALDEACLAKTLFESGDVIAGQ